MGNFIISAPGSGRQQRFAVNGTGGRTALNADLTRGGNILVVTRGAAIDFQFGGSSVPIPVINEVTDDARIGLSQAADFSLVYRVSPCSHIAWIATGAGFVTLMHAGSSLKFP